MLEDGVTAKLAPLPWAVTCCRNAGAGFDAGVTAFEAVEAGLVPTPFVAVTVKV
jgi:hypothetical protein